MTTSSKPGIPTLVWRFVKAWREELTAAVALTVERNVLALYVGFGDADLALIGTVATLVFAAGPKEWARGQLLRARRRRRWDQALSRVLPDGAAPEVLSFGRDRAGEWATVRVAAGTTCGDLADRSEVIAAGLGVNEVRVRRHPTNAAWAYVRALRADPLAGPPLPWPWATVGVTSLWSPVPVGLDEDGQPVTVTLFEHNLLLGGEPGSGKSVAVHQLVAAAALDLDARLWLLDAKLVELAPWEPVADGFAGTDVHRATEVLRRVQTVMDERYAELRATKQRKVRRGTPLHLVVIDELAHYLTWPDKRARDAFTDTLRDLVSRGRAAGVIVIAATQKPASDVVPTSLRDLFGYRWALRCTTPAASDTILGTGWATQGVSASTVNPAARGVGWLLHESGEPVRLRAYFLHDDDVHVLADRAEQLRIGANDA
jgi:hypothetical protein